ncbi:methyltransferase [Lachnotalea glycerini]|uniref:Uncharacterized protein n=1 Tax=Lachnotalea glycerini TaxID=1763509 RepID=A0A371JK12_9FIRM|nr:methyltransferase [Lachnotalea glycerini]RDY33073.1 hypothetical protein CG710_000665 [Lachnotalea glycerini]
MDKNLKNIQSLQAIVIQGVAGYAFSFAIKAAIEINLFNELISGPAKISKLAEKLEVNESSLARLIRVLMSAGLIYEKDDTFMVTEMGEVLQTDSKGSLEGLAKYFLNDLLISSMADLQYSIKTGKSSFEKNNGTSWYEYGKKNPDLLKTMDKGMNEFSKIGILQFVESYPFEKYHLIVDIAGGNGQIISAVLQYNKNANGILFDQPATIERIEADKVSFGLDDRCQLVSGDMFKKIPEGGNLYLISKVLNDWEDNSVIKILKNIKAAMSKESRLLIVESLIDNNEKISPKEAYRDLLFLVCSDGGKVRSKVEFNKLIEESGFVVTNVRKAYGEFWSIECKLH